MFRSARSGFFGEQLSKPIRQRDVCCESERTVKVRAHPHSALCQLVRGTRATQLTCEVAHCPTARRERRDERGEYLAIEQVNQEVLVVDHGDILLGEKREVPIHEVLLDSSHADRTILDATLGDLPAKTSRKEQLPPNVH